MPPDIRPIRRSRSRTSTRKQKARRVLPGLLAAFVLSACGSASSTGVDRSTTGCSPQAFGAVADGRTDNRAAIQGAIDACAAKGGGTVSLAGGVFLSGPVFLKTGVTLDVEAGATLLGTQDPNAYQWRSGMPDVGRSVIGLVNAGSGVSDVSIRGAGTVDGAGAWWWANHLDNRPRLIVFYKNSHVTIDGPTFRNSPSFHIVPTQSTDVVIRNVTILAPASSPNTDGIDPSSSRGVTISHCTIDVGDDDIAIKASSVDPAHPGEASADISITDCTFRNGHGLSIGTGLAGGVRRLHASRLTFDGTTNGIRIKADRTSGGEVGSVSYDSITMHDVDRPIDISGYYPESAIPLPGTDGPQPVSASTPNYHDVTISHLTATDDRPGQHNAALIIGVPELPLTSIALHAVSISGAKYGAELRNVAVQLDSTHIAPQTGPALIIEENATVVGGATAKAPALVHLGAKALTRPRRWH